MAGKNDSPGHEPGEQSHMDPELAIAGDRAHGKHQLVSVAPSGLGVISFGYPRAYARGYHSFRPLSRAHECSLFELRLLSRVSFGK